AVRARGKGVLLPRKRAAHSRRGGKTRHVGDLLDVRLPAQGRREIRGRDEIGHIGNLGGVSLGFEQSLQPRDRTQLVGVVGGSLSVKRGLESSHVTYANWAARPLASGVPPPGGSGWHIVLIWL